MCSVLLGFPAGDTGQEVGGGGDRELSAHSAVPVSKEHIYFIYFF